MRRGRKIVWKSDREGEFILPDGNQLVEGEERSTDLEKLKPEVRALIFINKLVLFFLLFLR